MKRLLLGAAPVTLAAPAAANWHCEDGRVFDASQRDELEDFELNECTPTEQAC